METTNIGLDRSVGSTSLLMQRSQVQALLYFHLFKTFLYFFGQNHYVSVELKKLHGNT